MDDRNVQYPNRHRDKNTGQVFDFEPMPGIVYKEGTPYNKANVLSDLTAEMFGSINPTLDQILRKSAVTYQAVPNVESNLAYLLAIQEVAGNVQSYSNFFYELFYASATSKVGKIDNRYMSYTGSLAAAATSIASANINFTNFPINESNRNIEYQEMTISDGTLKEKIFAKGIDVFDSSTYTEAFPVENLSFPAGTYRVTMKGGKGANNNGIGGNGGTLVFDIPLLATDVLSIIKIPGSGKGVKLVKNGTTIAVVGGGGQGGVLFFFNDPSNDQNNKGGDGGGVNGQDGAGQSSGDGAIGPTGGLSGGPGGGSFGGQGPGAPGLDAPDGSGGSGTGGQGGGGYAGGGAGAVESYSSFYVFGTGGGGSSFLDPAYTAIENSQGTNSGNESIFIATSDLELKTALVNSYTNPIIYRGNLNFDTVNHRATIKTVNSTAQTATELRILVKNPQFDFWNLASWIETTLNLDVTECRVAFGTTQDIDESSAVEIETLKYDSTTRQVRAESTAAASTKYAVLIFDISKTDANQEYIYKMLGVIN